MMVTTCRLWPHNSLMGFVSIPVSRTYLLKVNDLRSIICLKMTRIMNNIGERFCTTLMPSSHYDFEAPEPFASNTIFWNLFSSKHAIVDVSGHDLLHMHDIMHILFSNHVFVNNLSTSNHMKPYILSSAWNTHLGIISGSKLLTSDDARQGRKVVR